MTTHSKAEVLPFCLKERSHQNLYSTQFDALSKLGCHSHKNRPENMQCLAHVYEVFCSIGVRKNLSRCKLWSWDFGLSLKKRISRFHWMEADLWFFEVKAWDSRTLPPHIGIFDKKFLIDDIRLWIFAWWFIRVLNHNLMFFGKIFHFWPFRLFVQKCQNKAKHSVAHTQCSHEATLL